MAIDTAAKRASVQAYGTGLMRPSPDGTIGEGDRATLAWYYQGMNYDNPAAVSTMWSWFVRFRNFTSDFVGGFN